MKFNDGERTQKPLLVFVSGPYSPLAGQDVKGNVNRAIEAGLQVLERGHNPFIPHLNYLVEYHLDLHGQCPLPRERYLEWDLAILARCDVLLYIGESPGALGELQYAIDHDIPIIYDARQLPQVTLAANLSRVIEKMRGTTGMTRVPNPTLSLE